MSQPASSQPYGGMTRRPTSLLSLPDELLDDICKRLDFAQAAELMPTCKRLLPILRRYACIHELTIRSGGELRLLSRDSRWIGSHVTVLKIEFEYARDYGEGIWRRTPREAMLIRDALHRILRRLPNVGDITVRDLPYVACKALVEALAKDSPLKDVERLEIAEVSSDWWAHALPWHVVPNTSRLTSLSVDDIDCFTTSPDDNSTAVTALPSIERLDLSLAFQHDGTYPYKLTIDLPNLKELVLTDDWNLTIRGAALFLREPGIPSTLESLRPVRLSRREPAGRNHSTAVHRAEESSSRQRALHPHGLASLPAVDPAPDLARIRQGLGR